jgi:phosphoribosylformimino-5-aminoimidazole carboxamide ribonucleotide (ProFAR) isomerase
MVKGWQERPGPRARRIEALDDAGAALPRHGDRPRRHAATGRISVSTKQVLALTERPVIASGGVRTADDIRALRDEAARPL